MHPFFCYTLEWKVSYLNVFQVFFFLQMEGSKFYEAKWGNFVNNLLLNKNDYRLFLLHTSNFGYVLDDFFGILSFSSTTFTSVEKK